METVKRLFISLIVLFGCSAGAWAIEQDSDGFYLIGSVQDWKDFAALVQTTPTANAKMIADVDLGDDQTMVGSESVPYQGTFDGHGYKLTIAYDVTENYVAPFRVVNGTTIQNLEVDGTINTTAEYAGGIIGYSPSSSTASNVTMCRSSVSIVGHSSLSDRTDWHGGFVGLVYTPVHFTDCLSDGKITGSSSPARSYCTGFIGLARGGTSIFTNCLNNCELDVYATNGLWHFIGGTGSVTNSYVNNTISYTAGYSQAAPVSGEQLSNGTVTAMLQNNREEDVWVQDPELGIPMLKIFASPKEEYFLIGSVQDWKDFAALVETTPDINGKLTADVDLGDDQTMVGSLSAPYQGKFDGQGYTLTVNYNMNLTTSAVAPFTVVGDAVIQKLHVAGSIKQQYCAAGGVVGSIMGNVTIKECWVSAYMYVQGSGNLQGTIGGIASCCDNSAARNCSILIEDCVFSGEMGTGYHCGSIMSHVNGGYGNSAIIKNCLSIGTYASAIGSTGTFIRVGTQGDPYSIENCYFKTSWGAVQGTQATETQLADGTTATALQAGRTEEVWVQDPNTNLPLPKIFVKPNAEALDGLFTINASGEEVVFAQGNLQKLGNMYQFAKNQYDYFGTDQSDTHRDMFAFLDYNNPAVDEPWSMLSHDEWKYLLITRSVTNTLSADARFTMATIGDTYKGLIIFPDYYEHPEGTGFIAGVFNSNSNYTAQVSLEGWAMMEAAGCVFLPAAGYRSYNGTWYGVGEEMGYMSCTEHPKYISTYFTPYITPDGVYVDETSNKQTWTSIRLVLRKQPITYTVPASGVGTFSSEVNIHLPEGLNAHYCKTYIAERSVIKVVNISGRVVPANTGVLLSGTPGETFTLTATNKVADNMVDNELVAVVEPTHINATDGDYTNFMMKGGKFIKIADDNALMPAHRAYLPLKTAAISGSNAKEIMLSWDDEEATGVERMRNAENEIMRNRSIYNLNGQRLSAPQKGINIINGRRVIVK